MIDHGQVFEALVYQMHVWKGVAAGDAFCAGLAHGLLREFSKKEMLDYALAASVLKLTIGGDFNLVTDAEILTVIYKQSSKRLMR